jgi:hypothetical protein
MKYGGSASFHLRIYNNIAMTASSHTDETFNMGIFLYHGVEELDFCGPFEVLKAAAHTRSEQGQSPAWQVFTAGTY